MKKWIITGLVAAALAALWLSFHWWLSNVFPFLKTYSTEIDTAMKILVPAGTVLAFLISQWLDRPQMQTPSGSPSVNQTGQGGGVNVVGPAYVGGDVVGRDKVTNIYPAPVTAPTSTSLHQLPPPPGDFTGREKEIRELMEAVKSGGVTITGLQGMGGVGKTALALTLAEQLAPRYPDAQFYLDLKGVSKEPLAPKAAMEHVIRAYHPDTKLPEDDAALSALYQSVLHNQKALLLMDNAARDQRQIERLIPPPSCILLVTSRFHFTVPGLIAKNLDKLPPEDARVLMRRIAPRLAQDKEDHASELVKLCGYVPLAIRTVASALAARADLRPADMVRRLAGNRERPKLTKTDASLQLSYDLLTQSIQKRLCALAVFPDSFEVEGAAALWETESDPAKNALGELLVYSLLEFNSASGRYRLHDLVRGFADARLERAERAVAEKRHAEHYTNVLAAADELYRKGGESVTQGLALFELEWGNIKAGQAWAAKHTSEDKAAAELCIRFPDAGAYCLDLRLHPRERIGWLETSVDACRKLRNRRAEGNRLGNLGLAYDSLGEYRRAIEFHEQALRIAREIGDRSMEGIALGNLGYANQSLGEYRRAIEFHEKALVIDREIDDQRGEGQDLGNLGCAYSSLGEYRRAIEFQEQHLRIARGIGDRRSEGDALGDLGLAYFSLGEYRHAMEFQEQYLQIACEIGDRRGEANALWNMSLAFDKLGDRAKAIANAEAALKIYEQIEHPSVEKVRKRLADWRGKA